MDVFIIFISLLCLNIIQASELFVAHKGHKSVCIGTHGTIPTWILPTDSNSSLNYNENIQGEWSSNSSLNCNFNKENACPDWSFDETKNKSVDGQVTGYLWNDLNIFQTKQVKIPRGDKDKNYFVSILAKNKAYFTLSNHEETVKLKIIVNEGVKNISGSKLTSIVNDHVKNITCTTLACNQKDNIYFKNDKTWKHLKLQVSYTNTGQLNYITLCNEDSSVEWNIQEDDVPRSVKNAVFQNLKFSNENNQPVYWKLHQTHGLIYGSSDRVLIKTQITLEKRDICIEIYYTSKHSSVYFYIKSDFTSEQKVLLENTDSIKLKRININTIIPNRAYELGIRASSVFLFRVISIRECSSNDHYLLTLKDNNGPYLQCADLKNSITITKNLKDYVKLVPSDCGNNADVVGPDCKYDCKDLFHTNKGCKGVTVCNSELCSCVAGYYGTNCEQKCDAGKYGVNCDKDCGYCKNNVQCNFYDGKCPKKECQTGYKSPNCEQICDIGTYGENCNQVCSVNCLHEYECDQINGTCTGGCKEGYVPPQCHHAQINEARMFLIIAIMLSFIILLLLIVELIALLSIFRTILQLFEKKRK